MKKRNARHIVDAPIGKATALPVEVLFGYVETNAHLLVFSPWGIRAWGFGNKDSLYTNVGVYEPTVTSKVIFALSST